MSRTSPLKPGFVCVPNKIIAIWEVSYRCLPTKFTPQLLDSSNYLLRFDILADFYTLSGSC